MKMLLLTALCFITAAAAANAYDPGRASGYDRTMSGNRNLFKQDTTARRMQQEMSRGGDSKQLLQSYEQPAQEMQRDMDRGFYQQQRNQPRPEEENQNR